MWESRKTTKADYDSTKIQRSAEKQEARRDLRPRRDSFKGDCTMFGDTDLPLALIMEEILGWEKKPGQKDEEVKENQPKDTTPKKF